MGEQGSWHGFAQDAEDVPKMPAMVHAGWGGTGPWWACLHPATLQPSSSSCPHHPSACMHFIRVSGCRGVRVPGCRSAVCKHLAPPGCIVLGRRSRLCAVGWRGGFVPAGVPGSWDRHTKIKAWAVGSAAATCCLLPLRSCCCYGVYCCWLSSGALHPAPCFFTGQTIIQTLFAPIVAFSLFFPRFARYYEW